MTEDKTVLALIKHLKNDGWEINSYCLGHQRGDDIFASRGTCNMKVEVKGAKANSNSKIKKRDKFDSGQIKTHFGKAILKSYDSMLSKNNVIVSIAHPNNDYLRSVIGKYIPIINKAGIRHYWVNADGTVEMDIETKE